MTILVALVALAASPHLPEGCDEAYFLAHVERTEYVINGRTLQRVSKDGAGQVTRLNLDGMELSEADFRALANVHSLQSLSLRRTNVTDDQIALLRRLPALRSLVLNSTEISDAAIRHLADFPALRTLCVSDVPVNPQAIAELKQRRGNLGVGYSPRR